MPLALVHIELWLAFVAASIVLLILPGPTILTAISYSVSHGRRANLPLVAGVALGDATALLLSLFGLGALLATSGVWFTVVKWVGILGGTFVLLAALSADLSARGRLGRIHLWTANRKGGCVAALHSRKAASSYEVQ